MTWTAVAVLLAGIVIGAGIKFGRLRMRGTEVVVPYIERTDRAFTAGVVVVTLMSLVTIVQTNSSQARTETDQARNESCAREFRTALTYNATKNAETAKITEARTAEFDKLLEAIIRNATLPGPESRAANAKAISVYRTNAARLDRDREASLMSKTEYPDPTCGR